MLFNYLNDNSFTLLSPSSFSHFYSFLLKGFVFELFSIDVNDNDTKGGFTTRNNVLTFIKNKIDEFSNENKDLLNNGCPVNEREAYDSLIRYGWLVEENVSIATYYVEMTMAMRSLADFLFGDFQLINKSIKNVNINDNISGIISSAKSILSPETYPENRLSQLRNTQMLINKLAEYLKIIFNEIRFVNQDNLKKQTVSETQDEFVSNFDKLIVNGFTNITKMKNNPSIIKPIILNIRSQLLSFNDEDSKIVDILNSMLTSQSDNEFETKDLLVANMNGIINDIIEKLDYILFLRERSEYQTRRMISIYKNKMKINKIYQGSGDNYKELIIRSIQTILRNEDVPELPIINNAKLINQDSLLIRDKKNVIRKQEPIKATKIRESRILFDEAKKKFMKNINKSNSAIIEMTRNKMKNENIVKLHSDDIEINSIYNFHELLSLIKMSNENRILKQNRKDNFSIQKDENKTTIKEGWIEYNSFVINLNES